MSGLKVAVLVPDGAADEPLEELGRKTPLQAARTPYMDRVALTGATGTSRTVPAGMKPGSDVANLSLLGYDPRAHYGGRGPIEAANMGVEVPQGWSAFRCNLVYTDGESMLDYSAGHVGQQDAASVLEALKKELGDGKTRFIQGKSYRNLMLVEGDFTQLNCTPPHDIMGEPFDEYLPSGRGAGRIIELMRRSREILPALEVNQKRLEEGERSIDMIWPWGQGMAMELEPFARRFGLEGSVISAVDLVCGLGRLAGLRPISVPGMTGFLDTNYRGKGEAAVGALAEDDLVYVHVEATDEASHMGDVGEKIEAIQRFDADVVGPVFEYLSGNGGDFRLLVCPDHPTLTRTRTHDSSPVPYAVCGSGIPSGGGDRFCEEVARSGGPHFDPGWKMMLFVANREPWPQE